MTPFEAYRELCSRSREIAHLDSAMNLLYWDQRTNIPAKGHSHRVRHMAALAKMRHRRVTDPAVGILLTNVEQSSLVQDRDSVEAVNVRLWRRTYNRLTKIPPKLAVEIARTAGEGEAVWEKTRVAGNWTKLKPYLAQIVRLRREEAEILGYQDEPYDALLEDYDPGETVRSLRPLMESLREGLTKLLERLRNAHKHPAPSMNRLHFPAAEQEAFATEVARRLGYNLEAGRVDESAHPFSTGIGPGDVRITARYDEQCFKEGFLAVVHEAGHAIYRQGLPLQHWGTPISRPVSLGIDESQSLLWEYLVARSRAFWRHFYPPARERFPCLREVTEEDFFFSLNRVEPSLIRINADEVTYGLHIVLRFELEVALMAGGLEVDDLPDAWNEKMQDYLGLTPPDHASGVMQDSHWASGSIGSFPSYALGYLYAAQFMNRAEKDLGDLDSLLERGDFGPLREWLQRNVHAHGSRFQPRELVRKATGEELNAGHLLDYLERKYRSLYET